MREHEVYEIAAPIDMHGFLTTRVVVRLVSDHTSMKACLQTGVGYGGDTDTVASLCMGLLSLSKQASNDLPDWMYEELENGGYGREFLLGLDQKLG